MAIIPGLSSDEPSTELKEKAKKAKGEKAEKKNNYAGADLVKKFGESVFIDADFLLEEKQEIINLSPACDIHLGGGIPTGSLVTFAGKSGTGKTSTALQLAANAQQSNPNRVIIYDDVEHRLKKLNLKGIHGLDISKERFKVVRSTQEKILSAEDHLNIMIQLIKDNPGCVAVIDSSSALCSMSEMVEDVKANGRASGPKLLAAFCRQIAPVILVNKCIVIIIQHVIANTSGYGPAWVEDGGEKLKYQADVKMRIKGIEKWGDGDNRVGQIITWEIVKSALGPPVEKFESYLRYGYGLDDAWEIIDLACDIGLIKKGGAWFTLNFCKQADAEEGEKIQGQENLYQLLRSKPELYNDLLKQVKESLK